MTESYAIDPSHSWIGFSARHVTVTQVRSSFSEFERAGFFDTETPENISLGLAIEAASIDTRNADREGILAAMIPWPQTQFPETSFRSMVSMVAPLSLVLGTQAFSAAFFQRVTSSPVTGSNAPPLRSFQ